MQSSLHYKGIKRVRQQALVASDPPASELCESTGLKYCMPHIHRQTKCTYVSNNECVYNEMCDITIKVEQLTAEALPAGTELQNKPLKVYFGDSGAEVSAELVTLKQQSQCSAGTA